MAAIYFFIWAAFVWSCVLNWTSATNDLCPSGCLCLGDCFDCSRNGLIEVPKDLRTCPWVTNLWVAPCVYINCTPNFCKKQPIIFVPTFKLDAELIYGVHTTCLWWKSCSKSSDRLTFRSRDDWFRRWWKSCRPLGIPHLSVVIYGCCQWCIRAADICVIWIGVLHYWNCSWHNV